MKKKRLLKLGGCFKCPQKTRKIMKLNFVFMLVCCLNLSATVYSQYARVSLRLENVTLEKFIDAVKQQTGVSFLYNSALFNSVQKVSVDVKDEQLEAVLKDVLGKEGFYVDFQDEVVVIKKDRSFQSLQTQEKRTVSGVVRDVNGHTLPGVSVIIKGTHTGVSTDIDGKFEIRVDDDPEIVLQFSFVGMKNQEVKIGRHAELQIVLASETKALEEVVVTGYQTISKERATGSFDIISKDQLEKPTDNLMSRLVGTAAGLQFQVDAKGQTSFEIRGKTSLYANAKPLVVVDGFPVEGDFNSVNPNDVESVTILKDAATASIWGARAANGVIVVTTKRAKRTPLKVEVNSFVKVGGKLDLDYILDMPSSREVVEFEKFAYGKWGVQKFNDNLRREATSQLSPVVMAIKEHQLGHLSDEELDEKLEYYSNIDNKDQLRKYILQVPVYQQYNLTLSGSTERMNNLVSLMYQHDRPEFQGNHSNELMFNYRGIASVFKWLDVNLSTMFQYEKSENGGASSGNLGLLPYELLVNEDGSMNDISRYNMPLIDRKVPKELFPYSDWGYYPLKEIENQSFTRTHLNARIQAGLTFKLLEGLSVDSRIQYETFNGRNKNLYKEESFYVRSRVNGAASWDQNTDKITLNLPKGGMLEQDRSEVVSWNFRNQINFARTFAHKHDINLVAGTEVRDRVSQSFSYPTTYGYDDDKLTVGTFPNGPGGTFKQIYDWLGNSQTFSYTNSFSYSTDRYFSLYANVAYTYDGKYSISGSVRTDASNFISDDPKYRYAPFWSVGAAYQISREKFMQHIDWLDRLNVRLTYGYNGNIDNSSSFKPLIAVGATPNKWTDEYAVSVKSFGNPTLRWEKTGTFNVGIDYSVFRGKLYGKADFYNKAGKDLMASIAIPAVNGTTAQKFNNAAMNNRGVELEIGSALNIYGQDITWRGSLNFAYNRNKIKRLFVARYESNTLVQGQYVAGKDANTLWAYKYAGVYNVGTEAEPNMQPMIQGEDQNTRYDFTTYAPGDGRDYCLNMGTRVAPYTMGFSSTFKVYDFDLSFILTGKFGHVFRTTPFNYPTTDRRSAPNRRLKDVMYGDPMKIVPLPSSDTDNSYQYYYPKFYPYMDYLTAKASHVRMQELNLTYNLPVKALAKLHMSRLMIYAQANNLFTIRAKGVKEDPEYPYGMVYSKTKKAPTYSFGLKFEF